MLAYIALAALSVGCLAYIFLLSVRAAPVSDEPRPESWYVAVVDDGLVRNLLAGPFTNNNAAYDAVEVVAAIVTKHDPDYFNGRDITAVKMPTGFNVPGIYNHFINLPTRY